ncbi:unnamed protein product [Closterium sp. NIES-64]|nr:unnamed protein product [Closterium sp. NIES-64]
MGTLELDRRKRCELAVTFMVALSLVATPPSGQARGEGLSSDDAGIRGVGSEGAMSVGAGTERVGRVLESNGGGGGSNMGRGFELPDPPSRFDASVAWRHTLYRTADSCWSQQERHLYHTANTAPPSNAFLSAVEAFEAMQRECVAQGGAEQWAWVANKGKWSKHLPRHGPDREPCRYIVIEDMKRGVGNKITAYVTAFILGLLTRRAIITPPTAFLTRRFCNPFAHANASWTVDSHTYEYVPPYHPHRVFQKPRLLLTTMAMQLKATQGGARTDLPRQVVNKGAVWMDLYRRTWNMFCSDLWSTAAVAPFWLAGIDSYTIPSLHYIPEFADRLREVFPDGRAFTHAARLLMHPDNELWAHITTAFHANLAHFSHRLGLQIRSPDGIHLPLSARILQCGAAVSRYLPFTQPYSQALLESINTEPSHAPHMTMGVFVSSLSMQHMLELQEHYTQQMPIGNTLVAFWSLTSEEVENRKEQHLVATVIEIWLLSFCDRLLVTHLSSFGRVAAGLAGMEAFSMAITVVNMRHVDWRSSPGPVCERVPCEPCDTGGGNVKWSGCSWDFNLSRLAHGWERPAGFGMCAGFQFGLQDLTPLASQPPQ